MAKVLIGTASWTDPSLVQSGLFYPEGVKTAEARLKHYAQSFSLVEVDSSYYAMPSARNAALWVERTPDGFVFDVKAFRLFTLHPTEAKALPRPVADALPSEARAKPRLYYRDVPAELRGELWRIFSEALLPLDSAGKLGVVVFQLPPWVFPNRETFQHILDCQGALGQYRLAVEFRNAVWMSETNMSSTVRFLSENKLAYVCVDEPQGFKSSVPPVAEATAEVALVRFHGRNAETWEKKGVAASERFNYYYSKDEMAEWVPRVRYLREKAREVHLIMNTNYRDQGIVNARTMASLLVEE